MKEVFDLIADKIQEAYKTGYQAGYLAAKKPYMAANKPCLFEVGDEIMHKDERNVIDCEKIVLTYINPCDKTEGAGVFHDGNTIDELDLKQMIPTGRKFPEVVALLKKMQEGKK
jgi:hypothetical protein